MITKVQREGRELSPIILLQQIGGMNLLAISGGRKSVVFHTDSEGDTYRVRRIRKVTNGAKRGSEVIEAEQTEVYFDEVGEVAYSMSCWK